MINKKAIFWDNDGVLVDTEKYYFEATKQILKNENFDLSLDLYIDLNLVQAKGPWHLLDSKKYTSERIDSLKKVRNELYMKLLLSENILIDGVEQVVSELSKKYMMAIVTSSKPEHFNAIHSRTSLLKYFDFVLTSENYDNYKPHPEPYLKALKRSGYNKEDCLVIEDSRRGLLAAKRAGLDCIIIPNQLTKICDFSEADQVIESIYKLKDILL